ncbi:hypothetical protein JKP88DRAFT_255635 [Tribonema minus]|uniref:Uncharacterized protein n=1 Tax=Tribonema minus TaxID=303371 RepID=A0A836CFH0_9STRA|nr:hypothetical protein JKP88DRAFT_255635 [Tribonema minus]
MEFVEKAVSAAQLHDNAALWDFSKMEISDATFDHLVRCTQGLPLPDSIDLSYNRLTERCFKSLMKLLGANERCTVKLTGNRFSAVADEFMQLLYQQMKAAYDCVRTALGDAWVPAENDADPLNFWHALPHVRDTHNGGMEAMVEHDGMFVSRESETIVWHLFHQRMGAREVQSLPTILAKVRDWLTAWEERLGNEGSWTRTLWGRSEVRLPKVLEGASAYRFVFYLSFIAFNEWEDERDVRSSIANSGLDVRLLPMQVALRPCAAVHVVLESDQDQRQAASVGTAHEASEASSGSLEFSARRDSHHGKMWSEEELRVAASTGVLRARPWWIPPCVWTWQSDSVTKDRFVVGPAFPFLPAVGDEIERIAQSPLSAAAASGNGHAFDSMMEAVDPRRLHAADALPSILEFATRPDTDRFLRLWLMVGAEAFSDEQLRSIDSSTRFGDGSTIMLMNKARVTANGMERAIIRSFVTAELARRQDIRDSDKSCR